MNKVAKIGTAAVLGLTMLGGTVSTLLAADPTPTPPPQERQWQRGAGNDLGMRHGARIGFQALSSEVADALGMTADEIHAERLAGKSLSEIAAANGVSEDKLVELMLAAHKKLLDERVAAGTLTQAQAEAAYTQMQTRVKDGIERIAVGPNLPADGAGLGMGRAAQAASGTACDQPGAGGPGVGHRWGPGVR